MIETTIGQLMVNEALPPEMRNYGRVLDGDGTEKLFQDLAERYHDNPQVYSDVIKKLSDIGRKTSYRTGGFSFGLHHLRRAPHIQRQIDDLDRQIEELYGPDDEDSPDKQQQIIKLLSDAREKLEADVFDDARSTNNPLAIQIMSKARGNKTNLRSLLGADLLYVDAHNQPVPIPITRSISQGLTPAEYFASTYGARKSVIDTKLATADAGYFGKKLSQAVHRLVVTGLDDPEDKGDRIRGLPVETSDPGNVGSLLAMDVAGYKRNTPLTPKILKDLTNKGHEHILVRSPLVGGPEDGGIYARDAGVREHRRLPSLGEFVGIPGAQAISEKVAQGSLNSKHAGGVAGAAASKSVSGFAALDQLTQVPKTFKGGATHAQADGVVKQIEDAPQGGKFIHIDGTKHYVPHGYEVRVKPGDTVESGDALSEGTLNPAEIVHHKGGGEGRRYFVTAFMQAMRDSGFKPERRNVELIARGLINHVELDEEVGDYVPGDIVPYNVVERQWTPREGMVMHNLQSSLGKYLEQPLLHYTVGTKIRPSMLPMLSRYGINQLPVHKDPPPFRWKMIPARENLSHDPDPFTRMLGSGLKKSVLQATWRGNVSDAGGTSYVPALLDANTFGIKGKTAPPSISNPPSDTLDEMDDDF